jgi:signal transduction histidine kinase
MLAAAVAAGRRRRRAVDRSDSRSRLAIANFVCSALDVREVLVRAAWGICTLTGGRRSAVFAYEPSTSFLCGVVGYGVHVEQLARVRIRLRDSQLALNAVLSGRQASAAESHGTSGQIGEALGFEPTHCVPLSSNGELLGIIYFDAPAPLDDELATDFAAVAATAIQNARAYRRARTPVALAHASRVARDLHDEVAQLLFAIGSSAARLLEADDSPPTVRGEIERIGTLAARASGELREALYGLSADKPALLGLRAALVALAADTRERTGLEIELDVAPSLLDADHAVADLLYRVCREGLINIERHSGAHRCSLRCSIDDGWATALVEDDGRSVDGVAAPGRFGLSFLREAAAALDGTLEIRPRRPSGTALTATVRLAGAR